MEPREPQDRRKEQQPPEPGRQELKDRTAEVLAPIKFEAMALADRFRRHGFPTDMAVEMSAHWTSRDMGGEKIDDKVWKSLVQFVHANNTQLKHAEKPTSHEDLMNQALELNLKSALKEAPEIPSGADESYIREKQQLMNQALESGILNLQKPGEYYRSLEELAADYEDFAKIHGTTAATDFWLATRKVRIPHLREQAIRANVGRTEMDFRIKIFDDLKEYFANRYQQKYGTFAAVEQPATQENVSYRSLDELYQGYKQFIETHSELSAADQVLAAQQWMKSQKIEFSEEEQRHIRKEALRLAGEQLLDKEGESEQQLKAVYNLLSSRREAESYAQLKEQADEQMKQEAEAQKTEAANRPELAEKKVSKTDLAYNIVIPPILPLLEEVLAEDDPKNTGYDEILETVAEQWDTIKAEIPDADTYWADAEPVSPETNTPEDNLAFAIWKKYISENSEHRRTEKKAAKAAKKEGFLSKWKKKLFGS